MSLLNSLVHPLPLADISNLPWIAIIAIIGSFLIAIVGMVAGLWFAQRRQQMWHETARIALEKGQPLPQLPGAAVTPKQPFNSGNDFRSGLIMIATGVGLYLFFDALMGRRMAYLGAIPGLIGVALLLYAVLNSLFGRKASSPADRPPQS
jgi:hypothetical protein